MKWNDKLRVVLNKKPIGRKSAYFGITFGWIICGFLWAITLFMFLEANATGKTVELIPWLAIAVFLAIAYPIAIYLIDRKYGYIDAIHKHYLQAREERLKKIQAREEIKTKTKQEVQ